MGDGMEKGGDKSPHSKVFLAQFPKKDLTTSIRYCIDTSVGPGIGANASCLQCPVEKELVDEEHGSGRWRRGIGDRTENKPVLGNPTDVAGFLRQLMNIPAQKSIILPEKLRTHILDKNCVAFIGSGLSEDYPTWLELMNELCSRCQVQDRVSPNTDPKVFPEIAARAKRNNEEAYYDCIYRKFNIRVNRIPYIYNILFSLGFKCYMTINYDPVIYKLNSASEHPLPVHVYPNLDRIHMSDRSIYYLHGLIQDGELAKRNRIVLSQDEFDLAYNDGGPVSNLMIPTLISENILFLGCRLKEPVMEDIFRAYRRQQTHRLTLAGRSYGQLPSRYILLAYPQFEPNPDRPEINKEDEINKLVKYYAEFDIDLIWYDAAGGNHSSVQDTLEQLADLSDKKPYFGWRPGDEI